MNTDLSTQLLTQSRPAAAAPLPLAWAVGQILRVAVLERVDENTLRLAVNGQNLVAHTRLELPPGEQFTARVTAGGVQPQLTLLPPPVAESPASVVLSSLARALPQQAPLAETLPKLLAPLVTAQPSAELPPLVNVKLQALAASLPTLVNLADPAGLARGVAGAGTQLEAKLAQLVAPSWARLAGSPPALDLPVTDLKWQLLALRETVSEVLQQTSKAAASDAQIKALLWPTPMPRTASPAVLTPDAETTLLTAKALPGTPNMAAQSPQTPQSSSAAAPEYRPETLALTSLPKLLDDLNAGLARITTHQLHTAGAVQNQQLFSYFEIPIRTGTGTDSVTLEVASDGHRRTETGEAPFSIAVDVPIEALGTLRARIALAGDRIAITTWSDTPVLRDLIAAHLRDLDRALAAHGFEISPSVMRPIAAPEPLRSGSDRLIDTEA
ncbi:MAG: flagellar hook-length control protein FliK [Gammaproteobacteria bacterium]|nr:flagellar hook-length control protein FliK [Gammaproteobacteria bacterium]